MPMPLEPARLAFDDSDTPCSTRYGDVYHARAGGLEQAREVFLRGNALPQRWQQREHFTIVETGFGLGLSFLATWAAWRADPQRCERLHFVSVELHPFRREDLATLHARWPALAPLACELHQRWPTLTPGVHRVHLDHGGVVLTLLFGDAAILLPQLQCSADAFYLDGFSPARNPQLWSAEVLAELARVATAGATLATWSVSGILRQRLADIGFACRKLPGFATKHEMLHAVFTAGTSSMDMARAGFDPDDTTAGIGETTTSAGKPATHSARPCPAVGHAMIIGAGLAGSSIANRLAERGWRVELIDSAGAPGQGASGNLAGVLRPLPSLDDNRLARLTRAGALYGVHHLQRLEAMGQTVQWDPCGVLHLARDPVHEGKQHKVVEVHRYPEDYLRFVDRDEASAIADWPLALGGWWFPHGAWVRPPSLCAANLAAWPERIRGHFGRTMAQLLRSDDGWRALDGAGRLIAAAPIAILANGVGITAVEQAAALPVRSARGQVSHLPARPGSAPKVVVCRLGYVSPAIDGLRSAGATFSMDDDEPALRETDHRENLAKLDFILPDYSQHAAIPVLDGRVGFRPASPDRLPMVGAVPAVTRVARDTPLADIPRHPGLYAVSGFGARGLVWASLVAELLASQLSGEPWPIERELADAIDPARYLLRPARTRAAIQD